MIPRSATMPARGTGSDATAARISTRPPPSAPSSANSWPRPAEPCSRRGIPATTRSSRSASNRPGGTNGEPGVLGRRPAHPFASAVELPLGSAPAWPSRAVVFSNELFDAQPFHRVVFHRGTLARAGRGAARGRPVGGHAPGAQSRGRRGPGAAARRRDRGLPHRPPPGGRELAGTIGAAPWSGLFVAIDYGKSWSELITETPAGTARAYWRHTQGNDLLARPGEQDLTCHVCWDWIVAALSAHGFETPVARVAGGVPGSPRGCRCFGASPKPSRPAFPGGSWRPSI